MKESGEELLRTEAACTLTKTLIITATARLQPPTLNQCCHAQNCTYCTNYQLLWVTRWQSLLV